MTILTTVIAFYHKMLLFVGLSSFFLFCQQQENYVMLFKKKKKVKERNHLGLTKTKENQNTNVGRRNL